MPVVIPVVITTKKIYKNKLNKGGYKPVVIKVKKI